jgi:hypothetical protein
MDDELQRQREKAMKFAIATLHALDAPNDEELLRRASAIEAWLSRPVDQRSGYDRTAAFAHCDRP